MFVASLLLLLHVASQASLADSPAYDELSFVQVGTNKHTFPDDDNDIASLIKGQAQTSESMESSSDTRTLGGQVYSESGPNGTHDPRKVREYIAAFEDLRHSGKMAEQIGLGKNVFWLHIPKTGSSFFTTLWHTACPRLPEKTLSWDFAGHHEHKQQDVAFHEYMGPEHCDTKIDYLRTEKQKMLASHPPMAPEAFGVAVGFIRDPLELAISGYQFFKQDDYFADHNNGATKGALAAFASEKPVLAYAQFMQGMQTRDMLGFKWSHPDDPATHYDVEKAKRVLSEGMKFVGITDEWITSIFLWHAMFGGEPFELEFGNMRKTSYDEQAYLEMKTELQEGGWEDPYDTELAGEARKLVAQRVQNWFGDACNAAQSHHSHHDRSGNVHGGTATAYSNNALCQYLFDRGFLRE